MTLQQPKLVSHGVQETFVCDPDHYCWLLDHHDQAARIWMSLGAKNLNITDRGDGRFGWSDHLGSDIRWQAIHASPELRIWYAEGHVRPALLLPPLTARAVIVLRFAKSQDAAGRNVIQHRADLYVHSDSRTAAIAAKLAGSSVARMGEQFIGQVELFFSAMAWYLDRNPEMAHALMTGKQPPEIMKPVGYQQDDAVLPPLSHSADEKFWEPSSPAAGPRPAPCR